MGPGLRKITRHLLANPTAGARNQGHLAIESIHFLLLGLNEGLKTGSIQSEPPNTGPKGAETRPGHHPEASDGAPEIR